MDTPTISSKRHQNALQLALSKIGASPLSPYVQAVYLYGSCARNEQKWDSDVDLFVVFAENFPQDSLTHSQVRILQASVNDVDLYSPEIDMHLIVGNGWVDNNGMYYKNIRKDGKNVWSNK